MTALTNTIQNNVLASLTRKASDGVVSAIKQAASRTGVNFAYLVQQANAESSFNPAAKAKTSSASGLYQFLESTWMGMVDKYGDKHGVETEGKSRKEILALRNDPKTASLMAAEFAGENEKFLNANWGGDVGSTELYFAHFLGAGGASAFLKARDDNGNQEAAQVFPAAAKSNRNVFYDPKTGRAKSLDEVYAFFDKKFSIEDVTIPQEVPSEPKSHNSLFAEADTVVKSPSYRAMHGSPSYNRMVTSPVEIMLLAQLEPPIDAKTGDKEDTFSLYSRQRSYNE